MAKVAVLGLAWSIGLHAAVIRGTVLERASGHPIAESVVTAEPVPGTHASAQSVRCNADGQFELTALRGSVRFSVASGPGGIRGTVRNSGEAVAGAPVYLEGWDPAAKRRIGNLRANRTDMHGVYSFDGLAPGTYRVLSTFEYSAPEAETMSEAATEVVVERQAAKAQDLDLFEIR